jgi:hypothetical protein
MDIVELILVGKRRRDRWKSRSTNRAVGPEEKTKKSSMSSIGGIDG